LKTFITAFADEFGNNSFDFDSQGSHFIVATVIVKNDELENLKIAIGEIRKRHNFQTGEIKSSKVGKNHNRRLKILHDIAKLKIGIYALIVDKRKLKGEGFAYKKPFYKYLNGLLYKELFRTFPELDLYVDEHGGNEFLIEFKKYVRRLKAPDLFSTLDLNIHNSKNNEYIQVADFIAGTLGYIFDELKRSDKSPEFENALKPLISGLKFFPEEYSFEEVSKNNFDKEFNETIARACFLRIQDFIEKEVGNDQQKIDQIKFLKLLLLYQRANVQNKYISTTEILNHLNQSRNEKLNKISFRSKVIGNLRDRGIVIASGKQGYKIPTTANDIATFIEHGNQILQPMLNRISKAREVIKLATANKLDVLDGFTDLKQVLDNRNT
jgi:tetrahydromethanopterin S-methyltransferase subunit G